MIESVCTIEEYQKMKRALQLALDSLYRIEQMGTNTNLDIPPEQAKRISPEGVDAKMTREFILKGEF